MKRKLITCFFILLSISAISVTKLAANTNEAECVGTKGTCKWVQHDLFEDVKYPIPGKKKSVTR